MSATLPNFDAFYEDANSVHLITDPKKYYENKLFKNRVNLDFSLLHIPISLELLAHKVLKYKKKKVLVEFITKTSAHEFYTLLKAKAPDLNIIELTGDDNKLFRKQAIQQIKDSDKIIVITTQVIEAGVDIDMDIGFKDISIIDSEEQALGRINRSCLKRRSKMFFFHMDTITNVYRNDYRTRYNLTDKRWQKVLKTKRFDIFNWSNNFDCS